MTIKDLSSNFNDLKALDRILVGGAIVPERYSSGRPVRADRHDTRGAQEFTVATDRYLSRGPTVDRARLADQTTGRGV